MKYTKAQKTVKSVVCKIVCNVCGKQSEEPFNQEFVSISKKWGYYSNKDLSEQRADICEECWDKFVKTFKIPPVEILYHDIEYRCPIVPNDKHLIKAPFIGEISDEIALLWQNRRNNVQASAGKMAGVEILRFETQEDRDNQPNLYRVNVTIEVLIEGVNEKDLLRKIDDHISKLEGIHSIERFNVNSVDKS